MPVAIVGMHRSGTSMITRLLHLAGLNLGPADQLMQARSDNPEGFWESLPFVHINQEILGHLGGRWFHLPAFPEGWEGLDAIQPYRAMAEGLPIILSLREPWGFKDPRCSVTLPFWKSIWPDLKIVVCVRSPLEAAMSLLSRDRFGVLRSLRLWDDHYRLAHAGTGDSPMVVTHYEAYFTDPAAELRRVVDAIGLPCSDSAIASACATVETGLRHSRLGLDALDACHAPPEVIATYRRLLAAGGPVIARHLAGNEAADKALVATIRLSLELEQARDCLETRVCDLETAVQEREQGQQRLKALLAEARAIGEERAAWNRIYEERLNARRHRLADRFARQIRSLTGIIKPGSRGQ